MGPESGLNSRYGFAACVGFADVAVPFRVWTQLSTRRSRLLP
jgi:hypothetical protein